MHAEDRLRVMYAAFNARDIDGTLEHMGVEVSWPMAFKGGRVVGHDEVRAYWEAQWAEIDPTVEPTGIVRRPDGRLEVTIAQTVRDLDGAVIGEGEVLHVYAFDAEGLVSRMDVEEPG